jgi:hypothetical protein
VGNSHPIPETPSWVKGWFVGFQCVMIILASGGG